MLLRARAVAALDAGHTPPVQEALTCLREAPISEAQTRLIESGIGIVLVLDKAEGGVIVGLLTLHDLLRAQDALARQADEP